MLNIPSSTDQKEVYLCFIDYTKAFDRAGWPGKWEGRKEVGNFNMRQKVNFNQEIQPQVSRWLAVFLRKSLTLGLFSIIRAGSKHCNFLAKEYWIGVFLTSFLMQATTSFSQFPTTESYFLPLQLISDQIPTFLPRVKISYSFQTFLLPWPHWTRMY